ncbi:LysR substrate-binding domain-containing protein [Nocardia sp. NPDC051052]|uniref:LysR family transcriptional regulator n=1 Tax=Nocardia sp. NPDC051052 TaxID=3364322 RepID=UPI003791D5F9
MIEARRLEVLRVLAATGTVTATATALHLTPSAVSQQIKVLEREAGAQLVQREGRGVRLTPAAQIMIRHGERVRAMWEGVRAELDAHSDQRQTTLRIGAFPSALARIVAPAAADLRRTHPHLQITLTEVETTQCFQLLSSDQLDIAVLVPLPDNPAPDDARFEQQYLLDDPQDLVVASDHPLARRGASVELAEAAHENWIAAPEHIDQHQLILAACAAAGFTPRIAHSAQEWNAICSLVAHGFGVCLLPRMAPVAAEHAVARIPLSGEPRPFRRILTCIRRGSGQQDAVELGLRALHAVAD